MKLSATDKGLLIPKEMLGDNQEFEIIQEAEKIIMAFLGLVRYMRSPLTPLKKGGTGLDVPQNREKRHITGIKKTSSIWDLGSNPVECDVKDGAINHDRYLYRQ